MEQLKILSHEITIHEFFYLPQSYQKADKHLCVALRHKVRIRLHLSKEHICGIHKQKQIKDGKINAWSHNHL